jgi:4-azaleucine resistance transporter AzlC
VLRGMRDVMPIGVLVVPLAMAFGIAAAQHGLDPWFATFMSLLVCAGASQFAALELWVDPLPIALIMLITLAVNARHLIYGAAIFPWLAPLPPLKRYTVLGIMTDASWAYGMQSQSRYQNDAGILLGSGILLWTIWTLGTLLGALFGAGIGNPGTYGLDVVMVTFFATNLVGLWQGRDDLKPWVAAASGALLAFWLLPPGWHVIVGALAGGMTGVLADEG